MELIRRYKQQQLTTADVRILNNTIICLMVIIAATSIVWSVSMHILAGDFQQGIIGAKLVFCERDFDRMHPTAKELLQDDLEHLINGTDAYAALETTSDTVLPAANGTQQIQNTQDSQTTKKPKVRKIAHLFRTSSNLHVPETTDDELDDEVNTTVLPKIKFNPEMDRKYLSSMTIDVHQTRWHQGAAVQFIYGFPFLSEIVAIIWTAMCLIYQSGVKKYWGLPKPWRIVVPSILIFTLMTVGALVYSILANGLVKTFCKDLRENLSDPNALSCGQAISVLRPIIRKHEFSHDVYLNLFRISYIASLVLWALALLVMVLRFIFAVDFQLVEVRCTEHTKLPEDGGAACKEQEFTEVLLSSPQYQPPNLLLSVDDRHKSEDDFHSARSQFSEVATPLLEKTQPKLT